MGYITIRLYYNESMTDEEAQEYLERFDPNDKNVTPLGGVVITSKESLFYVHTPEEELKPIEQHIEEPLPVKRRSIMDFVK